ncbi:MAG: tetratricopeptide repeat protein, partial [Acidobacteriota bacterium]
NALVGIGDVLAASKAGSDMAGLAARNVERLEALIAKFPSYVRAYDRLGLCFEALGKNEEALEQYRRAVDLNRVQDPQWVWPPLNLGVLQTQMGQFEDAEGSLQEAVKIDPGFAQAHYRHGLALEKLSRFEDAATALRKAAELDPEYPDPHWALARVLRRDGDREGAAAAVREYQRLKAAREQQ